MSESTNKPLHKRTHWRRTREIIECLAENEHINLNSYDTKHMVCYTTIGDNMKGRDVTYSTAYGDGFWVSDNTYDVYEVPAKSNINNKYSFTGHFLTLIHNKSWDYWIFGTMTDSIDFTKTRNDKSVSELVHFTPYGQYSILVGNGTQDTIVTKEKKR